MTTFPGSPRLTKGALVGIEAASPVPSIIIFQYNPTSMTRTLEAQTVGGEGSVFETQRLKGAPVETFKLDEVLIDAADQLEKDDGTVKLFGIYPQLSALEMLIYPRSPQVVANSVLVSQGFIEIVPPMGPLTLFVWGMQRVLPVRITEFSITEEAYDQSLNPIRAKASLGLRVLSYNDLSLAHPGYYIFMAHQLAKEIMANIGSGGSLANIGNIVPFVR